jgi:hypothetical protein
VAGVVGTPVRLCGLEDWEHQGGAAIAGADDERLATGPGAALAGRFGGASGSLTISWVNTSDNSFVNGNLDWNGGAQRAVSLTGQGTLG